MDIRVGEITRSIPETWISRWKFLIDYHDFITQGRDGSHSVNTAENVVEWTYSDIADLDNWIRLNESIDSVTEKRKGTPTAPLLWPYDRDWQFLSSIWKIVEFMSPTSNEYMLHIAIDKELSIRIREEAYERLGRVVRERGSSGGWCLFEPINQYIYHYVSVWYYSIVSECEDYPLLTAIAHRIVGVLWNSIQLLRTEGKYRHMDRMYMSADELLTIDWECLSGMDLTAVEASVGNDTLPTMTINCMKRRLLESILCKFMTRQELPPHSALTLVSPQHEVKTLLTINSHENHCSHPFLVVNSKEAIQKLIETIDYYVDNTLSDRLIDVVKYLLGLAPIIGSGYYTHGSSHRASQLANAPIYYFIAVYNSLYKGTHVIIPQKRYKDVCLYLGIKWGTFYLRSCVKCLHSLLAYRGSNAVTKWEELITAYNQDKKPSVVAKSERKRILAFCEAATIAIDLCEEKSGGITTFSSLPVPNAGLVYK